MKNNREATQVTAWFLTAMIGPLLCILGKESWVTVLVVAAICSLLVFLTHRYGAQRLPRWLCIVELAWLTLFLGSIAGKSGTYWEGGDDTILIPTVLLLLASIATQRGVQQTTRTGATLMWLVLPALGIVLLAGSIEGNVKWIRNTLEVPSGLFPAFLLIPCLWTLLPMQGGKQRKWLVPVLGLVAAAGTCILDATVGPSLALKSDNGFYEFTRGVNVFGVAERFEALIACCLTGGWFALFTVFLSTSYHLAQRVSEKFAPWCVWLIAATAIGSMCILHIPHWLLLMGNLIFWVFLPIATQVVGCKKKRVNCQE